MPVSTHSLMSRVNQIIDSLKEISRTCISENPLIIGNISEFSEDELDQIFEEKVYVVQDIIMLSGRESDVHKAGKDVVNIAMNKLSDLFYFTLNEWSFNFVDKYRCGSVYIKRADGYVKKLGCSDNLIANEVAYTNESVEHFIFEAMNYVSEYSTLNYFIGLKVEPQNANFNAHFIVLEKRAAANTKEIEAIAQNLKKQKHYNHSEYCVQVIETPKFEKIFFNSNNVNLHFYRFINDQNFNEDFSFSLEGPKIHPSIQGEEVITVSGLAISQLRDEFHRHQEIQNN